MTNAIIILVCAMIGAFAIMVITGAHGEPVRSDRLIIAGIGAVSGFFVALAIIVFRSLL